MRCISHNFQQYVKPETKSKKVVVIVCLTWLFRSSFFMVMNEHDSRLGASVAGQCRALRPRDGATSAGAGATLRRQVVFLSG